MIPAPALASDLAPSDETGQYMAYNNLSTGLSGALASLIFGVKVPQKEIVARIREAK